MNIREARLHLVAPEVDRTSSSAEPSLADFEHTEQMELVDQCTDVLLRAWETGDAVSMYQALAKLSRTYLKYPDNNFLRLSDCIKDKIDNFLSELANLRKGTGYYERSLSVPLAEGQIVVCLTEKWNVDKKTHERQTQKPDRIFSLDYKVEHDEKAKAVFAGEDTY
jgi:hypothetical protein